MGTALVGLGTIAMGTLVIAGRNSVFLRHVGNTREGRRLTDREVQRNIALGALMIVTGVVFIVGGLTGWL